MNRSIIFIGVLSMLFISMPALATSPYVPGDSEEEVRLNIQVLSIENENEREIAGYLNHQYASTRLTACMRLTDVGTTYSLSKLTMLAIADSDPDVQEAASFALWNIKYREALRRTDTGGGKMVLLSVFDNTQPIVTKTSRVKGWAMGLFGDMGLREAEPVLRQIADSAEETPHSDYLKGTARENLTKISFINSFQTLDDAIEPGLTNSELCVRLWALRTLVKRNPPDLKDRLNALLTDALQKNDSYFASAIARNLEEIERIERRDVLIIEYPQDNATVKTPKMSVYGFAFGKPFRETISLNPGSNTYTKTVTKYGKTLTKSITINYFNQPPVLQGIGNKSATVGQPLTFQISAADPDDAKLLYFVYSKPKGAIFDFANRRFTWIPKTINECGKYQIIFKADDGWGLTAQETINITVSGQRNQAPSNLTASITNDTEITLNWTDNSYMEKGFKIRRADNAAGPYYKIGSADANDTTFKDTGLTPNTTYYYRVSAYNDDGETEYASVSIKLINYNLIAPSGLNFAGKTAYTVTLAWTDNSDNEDGFEIWRGNSAANCVKIESVPTDTATFQNNKLTPNTTYFYKVRAYNSRKVSDYTDTICVTTPDIPPSKPTNLTAAVLVNNQPITVRLNWQKGSSNSSSFKVERATIGGATFTIIGTTANISYDDTTVTEGNTYGYRVTATNSVGASAPSDTASAAIPFQPPASPTNLRAQLTTVVVAGNIAQAVKLDWTDNSSNEAGFVIEKKINAGPYTELGVFIGINAITYHDIDITPGNTYTYRIRAYRLGYDRVYSNYSNEASITIVVPSVPPPASPSNLTVTATTFSQVSLSWVDNSDNETGFKLERKLGANGTYAQLTTLPANTTSYSDTTVNAGNIYYYRVCAYNTGGGNSPYSNEVWIAVPIPINPPASPTNLIAQLTTMIINKRPVQAIKLNWTDNSSDESGFIIEKTTTPGPITAYLPVSANTITYNDTNRAVGKTYTYQIRAYKAMPSLYSGYSNKVNISIPANQLPYSPSGLTITSATSSQVSLKWYDYSTNEIGFAVERKIGAQGVYTPLTILPANTKTYNDTTVRAGNTYYYRVYAYNNIGNSVYSNERSVTTPRP